MSLSYERQIITKPISIESETSIIDLLISNVVMSTITHFNSLQSILSVGDRDLSFPLYLAKTLRTRPKLTATSLESYENLIAKYKNAKANIIKLRKSEVVTMHDVNVTRMIKMVEPEF